MIMSEKLINFTQADVVLPKRAPDSHKGSYGKVTLIAGSNAFPGAGYLALSSARCALASGAGYAKLCVPKSTWNAYASRIEGEILTTLPDEDGSLLADYDAIDQAVAGSSTVLVGPGLTGKNVRDIVLHLMRTLDVPLVLDAGALTALNGTKAPFRGAKCELIITPHPGEFAGLTGIAPSDQVPVRDSAIFAKSQGITVHLKGHQSVTAMPDGRVFVTSTGTPCLAKAGSGDVLIGIIGAMIAQKITNPVPTASVIHGLAGHVAEARFGEYGVLATDVINGITKSVARLMKNV